MERRCGITDQLAVLVFVFCSNAIDQLIVILQSEKNSNFYVLHCYEEQKYV